MSLMPVAHTESIVYFPEPMPHISPKKHFSGATVWGSITWTHKFNPYLIHKACVASWGGALNLHGVNSIYS